MDLKCDSNRSELLAFDWDAADRRRIAEALAHVEKCEHCQAAMADFDRMREALQPAATPVEPLGGWSEFETRLRRSAVRPRRRWSPSHLALAATLVLAVTGWATVLLRDYSSPSTLATRPPDRPIVANLTPEQVTRGVDVFDNVSQVFDHKASWVLISDADSDVGLSNQPVQPGDQLLLLRLALTRDKEVASAAELAIVAGQDAELSVSGPQGARVRYRIATSKTRVRDIRLVAEIGRPGDRATDAACLATSLHLEPGHVVSAGEVATSSGRYALNVGCSTVNLPGPRS